MAVRRRRAASSALGGEREREGERVGGRARRRSWKEKEKDILIHTLHGEGDIGHKEK